MPEENWLEKVIKDYRVQNPSINEEEINSVRELVLGADVQEKELRQSETTRHAQNLLNAFLDKKKESKTEHES